MNNEPINCTPIPTALRLLENATRCLDTEDALMDARICKHNNNQLAHDLCRLLAQAHQLEADPGQVNELARQLARDLQ